MKTLGICASYGLHVVIISDEKTIFSYSREDELKSDNLLSIIDEGLASCKLNFSDIDCVAACVGPGSFTGSRVAISLVKGMFVGQNKKLISFESFDCYGDDNVILSGFGKFVYLKNNGKKECVEIDKIKNFSGVTDCQKIADALGIRKTSFDMSRIINKKIAAGEFVSIAELMPVYLRASQAEIDREKKNDRR